MGAAPLHDPLGGLESFLPLPRRPHQRSAGKVLGQNANTFFSLVLVFRGCPNKLPQRLLLKTAEMSPGQKSRCGQGPLPLKLEGVPPASSSLQRLRVSLGWWPHLQFLPLCVLAFTFSPASMSSAQGVPFSPKNLPLDFKSTFIQDDLPSSSLITSAKPCIPRKAYRVQGGSTDPSCCRVTIQSLPHCHCG